jgi:DNA gyrase subunit A
VNDTHEIMLITDQGQTIRTRVSEVKETASRGAMGVKVMTLGEGERVVAFERLAESENEPADGLATPDAAAAGVTGGASEQPPAAESEKPPSGGSEPPVEA